MVKYCMPWGHFVESTSDASSEEDKCGLGIRSQTLRRMDKTIYYLPFIHCKYWHYGLVVGGWKIFTHLNFSQKRDQTDLNLSWKYMLGRELVHRNEKTMTALFVFELPSVGILQGNTSNIEKQLQFSDRSQVNRLPWPVMDSVYEMCPWRGG